MAVMIGLMDYLPLETMTTLLGSKRASGGGAVGKSVTAHSSPSLESSKDLSSNCQAKGKLPLTKGVCTTIDGGQYRRLKPVCPRCKEDVTGVGPVNRVVK